MYVSVGTMPKTPRGVCYSNWMDDTLPRLVRPEAAVVDLAEVLQKASSKGKAEKLPDF